MENELPLSPFTKNIVNKMSGDMKFLGVFTIVIGAISCLTIIGAVIGIPYIIAGLRLKESGEMFRGYLGYASQEFIERAIEKQSQYFHIQKIIAIITIVFMVLYFIFIIIFLSIFLKNFDSTILHTT
ncbi:MAG: DUF5362 domain-containing protein [Ignavibacteriaceae bacterium]|nr:DUF5362 domain-containing protein [Ignavibacteriaceae bacterium]